MLVDVSIRIRDLARSDEQGQMRGQGCGRLWKAAEGCGRLWKTVDI